MTDYFQDIVPPEDGEQSGQQSERSIRNITLPSRNRGGESRSVYEAPRLRRRGKASGTWLWVLAVAAILVVGGLGLFVFRKTTVTVTPRVHDITLDGLPALTAYPAVTAATGTLTYTVQEFDLEESEPVKASGMQHVERKASGSIIVMNDYSATPVKLLANTRFESAGLIFRTPAAVVVPGKKGSTPGSVSVTVVADGAGEQYNIAPGRFTLPGLKSGKMFDHVYATSDAAFAGGFSGDEPATDPATLSTAMSAMRGRIEQKVRDTLSATGTSVTLPGLARVTYTDMPSTPEETGSVRLHERAHISVPAFDRQAFTVAVGGAVSADAAGADVQLVPGQGFTASSADQTTVALGTDPISFTLGGKAQLVWQVDADALARSLAGRDGSAFQTIIKGFPGVEEAKARIEPFWSTMFPKDATTIRVVVQVPNAR